MFSDTRTTFNEIVSTGAPNVSRQASVPQGGIFGKEGDYWAVGLGGSTIRLKDSKGLAYLACLLRHPAAEFHVLDLIGGIPGPADKNETAQLVPGEENLKKDRIHVGGLGDVGELLDNQAKSAYRRRLSELQEALEEAKVRENTQQADQLKEEIDALIRELSRAVGLAGRNRRAASASERARQTVTKAIRAAIERIARSDTRLGKIFLQSIKTGTFCAYQPGPELPIRWEFGTSIEPSWQPASVAEAAAEPALMAPRGLSEFVPFSTPPRTCFVGRENESRAIRAAIAAAQSGNGFLMMLGGGPGVGKTRLATEMAEYAAREGFVCVFGHCYERDEPFPYLPFVQIIETMLAQAPSPDAFRRQAGSNLPELAQLAPSLRRVFPDMPEPLELPDAQKQRFLFQSLAQALGRATQVRPYLLILDDLHWADESTLALLTHLANQVWQLPLVIFGTYRDEYLEDNPALARTLEELIHQGVRPLKLAGLSKDAVSQMLKGLSHRQIPEGLVNTIFEQCNGNPFFVEEVYQHLAAQRVIFDATGRIRAHINADEIQVPENVRLIIGRQFKRLSDVEIRALGAAAVIGRSFSFQRWAAISQIATDALFTVAEKAQRIGILASSADTSEASFTFAHELVRQTLIAYTSITRQRLLQIRIAASIERLHPAPLNGYVQEIGGVLNARFRRKRAGAQVANAAASSAVIWQTMGSGRNTKSRVSDRYLQR
jgi:hypothetical protein